MKYPTFTISSIKAKFGTPKFELPVNMKPKFSVESIEDDLDDLGEILAQKFYAFLMENILTNKYNFKLLPETERRKGNWVGSVPWIDSRTLISGLMVNGTRVGFIDGKYPGTELDYDQLAMILEFGIKDKGVPPRDVFRKSFRDFQQIAEAYIEQYLKPVD